jgi:hypothetical protein
MLLIEARDQASEVVKKWQQTVSKAQSDVAKSNEEMAAAAKSAADTAANAARTVEDAQTRAAASARAYERAMAEQSAAMEEVKAAAAKVAEADQLAADAAKTSGDEQAAAYARASEAAKAAADAEEAALARVREAERAASASATEMSAAQARAAELQAEGSKAAEGSAGGWSKAGMVMATVGVGAALVGAKLVKSAGDFQDATTHLVTDAGETAKNLSMVQSGMLAIAAQTGTSATQLNDAMYHIESAGYHGAAGLTMLKTAAEGAKVGGADLDTVSRTLVGTMNAYGMSAKQSTSFMNQLIATVGAGDMRMQDLASALSAVAPLAAAAHISFAQVGGAIATMTAQGMSAQQSTQNLANAIRSLQKPNAQAVKEMQQMGLNSNDVAQNLGKRGLTGTIEMLTQSITSHMGSSGQVLWSAFQNAKTAAADAQVEIKAMPANLQKLAQEFLNGSISAKTWTADLKGLPPMQAKLMTQFATTAEKTKSFNSLLASGSPAAQTYTGALAQMMGGATGLNVALMLSGGRMATFQQNVATVADAAKKGGSNVDNWSTIQKTFNQQVAETKQSVESAGIAIGTALLPAVQSTMKQIVAVVTPISEWVSHNKDLVATVGKIAAGLALLVGSILMVRKAVSGITTAFNTVTKGAGLIKKGITSIPWSSMASGAKSGFDTVRIASMYAWDGITDGAGKAASGLKTFGGNLASLATSAGKGLWSGITTGVSAVADGMRAAKTAIVDFAKSEKVAAAAQKALDIAMDASPIILVISAVALLVVGFIYLWDHFKGFRDFWIDTWKVLQTSAEDVAHFFVQVWQGAVRIFEQVWNDILGFIKQWWPLLLGIVTGGIGLLLGLIIKYHQQIWDFVVKIWNDILGFFRKLWQDIVSVTTTLWSDEVNGWKRIWTDLTGWATRIWHDITGFFTNLWHDLVHLVTQLWSDEVAGWQRIWTDVTGWAQRIWHDLTGFFTNIWRDLVHLTTQFWQDEVAGWQTIWHSVVSIAQSLWHDLSSVWSTIENGLLSVGRSIWSGLQTGFKDAVSGIGTIWHGLEDVIKAPVNFVIGTIYDDGIVKLWNDVAGAFGASALQLPKISTFATGGVVPGYAPGRDSVHALLSPGEGVLVPEALRAFGGAGWLNAVNAYFGGRPGNTSGMGAFGGGGIIGSVLGGLKSLGGGIAGIATSAWDGLKGVVLGGLKAAASPVVHGLESAARATLGTSGFGGLLDSGINGLGTAILNFLGGKDATAPKVKPGQGGAANASAATAQAYAQSLLGSFGWGPDQMQPLIYLWNQESGWNDNAVNPSSGAYGIPQALGHGHPFNLGDYQAQIQWGLNYIKSVYGSPAGAWAHEVANNWYDSGGVLSPGVTVAHNGTGQDEYVLTAGHMRALGGGPTINVTITGNHLLNASAMQEFWQSFETWFVQSALPNAGVHLRWQS